MGRDIIAVLSVVGVVFGLIGGIAAFLNAYDGYSHFPAITKRKRIMMSIEFGVLGFFVAVLAVVIMFFFITKIAY
jgi:hypothetical protein